jgi:ferredoxin-thioredoxin reductase catalytic subunit
VEQTQEFIQNAARHYGWTVNPDAPFIDAIAEGLTVNANRYGYYLCPCRDGDGDRKADDDIVCPCVYAQPDIDEYGQCFCGLFLSREKAAGDATVQQIPERRSLS